MTLNPILFNLVEALGEVSSLEERLYFLEFGRLPDDSVLDVDYCARKESRTPFSVNTLRVSLEHAYHHLNWAANCRNEIEDSVWHFSDGDAEKWGAFPMDEAFADLWPRCASACKKGGKRKLELTTIRTMGAELARIKLDTLVYIVAHKLGEKAQFKVDRPAHLKKGIEDIDLTEEAYCERLCSIYYCLNTAWNARYCELGEIIFPDHMHFPKDIFR